ncbi:MAG TPA: type ISP restriction/modification enzyme [Rhodanobacteraceae bacterium]|nr:type ISP restriction/modification enzyme [Rhodanobacteraceae bacterium]
MSSVLIQQYLAELARLRQVGGTHRESVVREAFKDLLKNWGRAHDLTFVPEYEIESPAKERRYVDGALLYGLRLPFGYWEAKDERDDLDAEIELKFKRGYPQDNIVFEDSREAVLIQNRREVMRCAVDDVEKLQRVLELFFGYERPEIAEFRKAVEQFKADLPAVCEALRGMIEKAHADNAGFRAASDKFLKQAQEAINPSLGEADVREILIQHILTEEIFALVFPGSNYHEDNNIARELYKLEHTFFTGNTKHQTLKALEPYHAAIRRSAAQISSHHEKQTFLKVVYENFYKVYNPKAADRLGVVYTPNEIVRFMIESADWLCEKHFGRNLVDRDVEILDPAAGTGTFISELLEHFRGQPAKLKHKYLEELHANEVAILPYYVANLNIEATYAAISGEYLEYPNLCFVDTLDNVAGLRRYTGQQIADLFGMGEENVERIKRQNRRKISVVIGNPPYNANQANENDNNKNREYPDIDARIKDTYIKASTAQKTKLYDMYARFFRWASDRIAENGVVAFISNRSYIDSRTFDGFRDVVAREFNEIHVVDLGADVRANPKLSGTKHNVFGIQTGVAIGFLVKRAKAQGCRIFYSRRPELETAEEKLAWLSRAHIDQIEHTEIRPDARHNWLNLTDNDFDSLIPLIDKRTKMQKKGANRAIFKLFGNGINTARDQWVTDIDVVRLREKAEFFLTEFARYGRDEKKFAGSVKWSRNLKNKLVRGMHESFDPGHIHRYAYRPYFNIHGYLSPLMIDELGQFEAFDVDDNVTLNFPAGKDFRCLATRLPSDFHYIGDTKVVGLLRKEDGQVVDNITDWALKQFRDHYKNAVTPAKAGAQRLSVSDDAKTLDSRLRGNDERAGTERASAAASENGSVPPLLPKGEGKQAGRSKARAITKMDIFHYVYAVLHDPVYREKYAQNLKREFPRIPLYGNEHPYFWRWADWGKALMDLHIGYESVEPWPLARTDIPDEKARKNGALPKAMLKADKDNGRIVLDSETTLSGVPPEAWEYRLGNRSALEWILDQYKEKKPKDPTIREQFNTYRFANYKIKVIDLLARVTRVSVETRAIVEAMRAAPRVP